MGHGPDNGPETAATQLGHGLSGNLGVFIHSTGPFCRLITLCHLTRSNRTMSPDKLWSSRMLPEPQELVRGGYQRDSFLLRCRRLTLSFWQSPWVVFFLLLRLERSLKGWPTSDSLSIEELLRIGASESATPQLFDVTPQLQQSAFVARWNRRPQLDQFIIFFVGQWWNIWTSERVRYRPFGKRLRHTRRATTLASGYRR